MNTYTIYSVQQLQDRSSQLDRGNRPDFKRYLVPLFHKYLQDRQAQLWHLTDEDSSSLEDSYRAQGEAQ